MVAGDEEDKDNDADDDEPTEKPHLLLGMRRGTNVDEGMGRRKRVKQARNEG